MARTFTLTNKLVALHRSGAVLCLSLDAVGMSFSMLDKAPTKPCLASVDATSAAYKIKIGGDSEDDDDEEKAGPPSSQGALSSTGQTDKEEQYVAVIQVRGLLSAEASMWDCGFACGYSGPGGIADQSLDAHTDPSVVAVVYDVLSPGGDALGCGEAAALIASHREMSGKPVLAFARQACSAAYWVAIAAVSPGGLYVSESSDVGSIGCWSAHADYSEANKKEGVAISYIADPPGKVLGNPDEPLSDAGRARMDANVKEASSRVREAVAAYRPGITADAVNGFNGATYRGADAVSKGLADAMAMSLEEVIAAAYQNASANQQFNVRLF